MLEIMKSNKIATDIDFLTNGPWYELYVISKNWQSDIAFYRDDVRFLFHLIDKYFLWLTRPENLKIVQELQNNLHQLEIKCKDLLNKLGKHTIQLGYLIENPNKSDAGIILTEHEHLEEEIAAITKLFRKNRTEVFAITEYIIDSAELASKLK